MLRVRHGKERLPIHDRAFVYLTPSYSLRLNKFRFMGALSHCHLMEQV
jgi:hypothetical protein